MMGQSCMHTMPFKHTASMDSVIQAIYNTARVTDTPTHPHSHLPPPAPLTHTKHTMQAISHQMSDQQINTGNTHSMQNVRVCVSVSFTSCSSHHSWLLLAKQERQNQSKRHWQELEGEPSMLSLYITWHVHLRLCVCARVYSYYAHVYGQDHPLE